MVREKRPYQNDPGEELRAAVWAAGRMTPLQLIRVAAWKSARGLAELSLNTEDGIRNATEAAVRALSRLRDLDVLHTKVDWSEWTEVARTVIGSKQARSGLLGLAGVGYPMATAITCFLAPLGFPVMDKWTIRAVFGDVGTSWQTAAAYAAFTRRLKEVGPAHYPTCRTIHQVDQAVMNSIMGCSEPRDACQHVPFLPVPVPRTA